MCILLTLQLGEQKRRTMALFDEARASTSREHVNDPEPLKHTDTERENDDICIVKVEQVCLAGLLYYIRWHYIS